MPQLLPQVGDFSLEVLVLDDVVVVEAAGGAVVGRWDPVLVHVNQPDKEIRIDVNDSIYQLHSAMFLNTMTITIETSSLENLS